MEAQATNPTILPPDIDTHLEQSAMIAQRKTMLKNLAGTSPTLRDLFLLMQNSAPQVKAVLESITLDEIRSTGSMVSLPTTPAKPQRSVKQEEALANMRDQFGTGKFSHSELVRLLGCSANQGRYLLQKLIKNGTIERTGDARRYLYSFVEEETTEVSTTEVSTETV